VIVSHNYPYLDITCWVGAQKLQGSAYVDTGFDGCLIVPEAEAKKLMVPFHPTVVELGDGSLRLAHEHRGVIEIGQARFRATVLFLGNEYLLGREVVDRMRICFHWGERLEVEFQRQ
jgi:predicted aspartyl protease